MNCLTSCKRKSAMKEKIKFVITVLVIMAVGKFLYNRFAPDAVKNVIGA